MQLSVDQKQAEWLQWEQDRFDQHGVLVAVDVCKKTPVRNEDDTPDGEHTPVDPAQLYHLLCLFFTLALQSAQVKYQRRQDKGVLGADHQGEHQTDDAENEILCGEESSVIERNHDSHACGEPRDGKQVEDHHRDTLALCADHQVLHEDVEPGEDKGQEEGCCGANHDLGT